jgi:hypothetical protein
MTDEDEVARAIAFFEHCLDIAFLRRALAQAAPRAAEQVRRHMRHGGEASVPPPAEIGPAPQPATESEALRTLATTSDFALFQALTRAIGRRVEALSNPPNSN